MKLVLMGTGPFAVPTFDALRAADHQIARVVTRPQLPTKSRRGPPPSPVRQWALENNLTIYDPQSINDDEATSHVARLNPDLLVVCDYGQILKPDALSTARLGGINLHGSLLPKYRGAAPVQWAILNGDAKTGVSVIHMTPRLDGGPVISSVETEISPRETAGELEERLSKLGVDAVLQAVHQLENFRSDTGDTASLGRSQDALKVCKAPRLSKSDGLIDWGRSAEELSCHVRGMNPWPLAFTFYKPRANKPAIRVAVDAIDLTDHDSEDRTPGEILHDGFNVLIATGDRAVRLARVQPAGKKVMTSEEFFRGYPPPEGAKLFAT